VKLLRRWKATQFPDTLKEIEACSMTNYSERDLVRYAQDCGFTDIHMELHIDVGSSKKISWEVFTGSSPHPLAPSLNQILTDQFTRQERELFEAILRPVIETYGTVAHDRMAYLQAVKR
jgi:arsenite methyltransferase